MNTIKKSDDAWDANGLNDDGTNDPISYELIVGNIGTSIYMKESEAIDAFDEYVQQSKTAIGSRGFGEDVILMYEDDIIKEYVGHLGLSE